MMLEAASNAEVSQVLATLPLWASQKTEVIPLESYQERQAMHRQLAERLRAAER
jgi:muconolactone delta-isomerase